MGKVLGWVSVVVVATSIGIGYYVHRNGNPFAKKPPKKKKVEYKEICWEHFCGQPMDVAAHMREKGNVAGASQVYEKIIKVNRFDRTAYNELADVLKYMGHGANHFNQPEVAIEEFKKALEIFPADISTYLEIANSNMKLAKTSKDPTEARVWLETAEKLSPQNPTVHTQLGRMHKSFGAPQVANHYFKRAYKYGSKSPDVLNLVGKAYEDSDKLEQAATAFETAIEVAPEAKDAYNNLAAILTKQGRVEEATALINAADNLPEPEKK